MVEWVRSRVDPPAREAPWYRPTARRFYVTLIVYLTGVLLTAISWNFWSFAAFRVPPAESSH